MAKRTSNRSSAQDAGLSEATQPKGRRTRPNAAPPAPEPDMIASDAALQETGNNSTNIPNEAGDDAPLEAMSSDSTSRSMGSEPSEADIRLRAYHRYLERGSRHGTDFEDWLEAERELKISK
jgi:DUF2934 family protein